MRLVVVVFMCKVFAMTVRIKTLVLAALEAKSGHVFSDLSIFSFFSLSLSGRWLDD